MDTKAEREIKALITLLGDDDGNIREIARQKLVEYGDSASHWLKEVAFNDSEGRIRIEAQSIIAELRLERLTQHFKELSNSSTFDLERGCFLLAQIDFPSLDVPVYEEKIDNLAREVQMRVLGVRDVRRRVQIINQFLFYEQGFRGNVNAYYDPQNSYINKVLDRRLGIPISLSALYLFVAKRLSLPIYGVSMPGHFLLKFQSDRDVFYIDAFNQGKILSKDECKRFLNRMGYTFHESYLATADPRDILTRLTRNLVLIYHQNNQQRKVDILERFISIIERRESWNV